MPIASSRPRPARGIALAFASLLLSGAAPALAARPGVDTPRYVTEYRTERRTGYGAPIVTQYEYGTGSGAVLPAMSIGDIVLQLESGRLEQDIVAELYNRGLNAPATAADLTLLRRAGASPELLQAVYEAPIVGPQPEPPAVLVEPPPVFVPWYPAPWPAPYYERRPPPRYEPRPSPRDDDRWRPRPDRERPPGESRPDRRAPTDPPGAHPAPPSRPGHAPYKPSPQPAPNRYAPPAPPRATPPQRPPAPPSRPERAPRIDKPPRDSGNWPGA